MTTIAIGGGELNLRDNLPFYRMIVKMTQKSKPDALFVPTASNDNPQHYKVFKEIFGEKLGCKTNQILLMGEKPMAADVIEEKIENADIVFVGPGNSLMMMRRLRHLKVAPLLRKASRRGAIMAGIGAGASCWFEFGHSDAMSFYDEKEKGNWKFLRVKCLGIVDRIMLSPYYNNKERQQDLEQMVYRLGTTAIGLPEKMTLVVQDGRYKLFTNNTKELAYKIYKLRGKSVSVPIEVSDNWRPLGQLLSKPLV